MTKHYILEIDEGSLSLVVAEIRRRRVHIHEAKRVTLSSMEGSALVFALHDALKGFDKSGAEVHVILSDPNFLHFDLQVPRLDAADLQTVMTREARRLGSIPDEDKVLLGSRQLEKVGRKTWRYAVVALPEKCMRPISDALKREGLQVDSLTSVEEAGVRLLAKSIPDAILYLDHGASRIRFVYVERGVITQRRHILAPGLEDKDDDSENAVWVDQLSMEIGWHLDYLGDMGKARPEGMAFSLNLDLSEEQVDKIRGELPVLESSVPACADPDGDLSQATQGVLQSLVSGGGITVFGRPASVRRFDKRMALWTVLSSALCLASLAGTGWVTKRGAEVNDRIKTAESRLQGLQLEWEGIAEFLDGIESDQERPRLRTVLGARRPLSLFIAESCRKVPVGISLVELSVKPDGVLLLRGRAAGQDRLGSLGLVKAYRQGLQELEFLEMVRERVERFEGEEPWLDFLILARWREDG